MIDLPSGKLQTHLETNFTIGLKGDEALSVSEWACKG